jgi:hypothetical protein
MWKDCVDYCETTGCNNGIDYVASLFDQGNDLECFSCKYARDKFGNILGGSNDQCLKEDVTGVVPAQNCPMYANAACYSASTFHKVIY